MQEKRKILFLPRWYPSKNDVQNGTFIQKHARAAAEKNEVLVLYAVPTAAKTQITDTVRGNLREIIIYHKSGSIPLLNFFASLKALFAIWKFAAKKFNPDICHVNVIGRQSLLALWLKWRRKIPFIVTEHWSGYITGKFEGQNFLKKKLVAYVFRSAVAATAVSETLRKPLLQFGWTNHIRLLPNVVEVEKEGWKRPLFSHFTYLVVADLKDEIKNISGVIRAFSKVYRNDGNTQLVIVGGGQDENSLKSLVRQLQLQNACHFTGIKSNAEALQIIPTAHVIIINSRIETFSMVTLEAIFSGRLVIATRCGGPEQFINARNGILIEKDNDEQLENAMLAIKKNYASYPPAKVKDSVPNIYDIQSIGKALDSLYDEAISASHHSK